MSTIELYTIVESELTDDEKNGIIEATKKYKNQSDPKWLKPGSYRPPGFISNPDLSFKIKTEAEDEYIKDKSKMIKFIDQLGKVIPDIEMPKVANNNEVDSILDQRKKKNNEIKFREECKKKIIEIVIDCFTEKHSDASYMCLVRYVDPDKTPDPIPPFYLKQGVGIFLDTELQKDNGKLVLRYDTSGNEYAFVKGVVIPESLAITKPKSGGRSKNYRMRSNSRKSKSRKSRRKRKRRSSKSY